MVTKAQGVMLVMDYMKAGGAHNSLHSWGWCRGRTKVEQLKVSYNIFVWQDLTRTRESLHEALKATKTRSTHDHVRGIGEPNTFWFS
jgi:hypothetical protein